ncbi:MAG: hypothetical protein ACI4BI_04935 [Anaerotardibacter sp.]
MRQLQGSLSFLYLCPAAISGDDWVAFKRDESIKSILSVKALRNSLWCPTDINPHVFERFILEVDEL